MIGSPNQPIYHYPSACESHLSPRDTSPHQSDDLGIGLQGHVRRPLLNQDPAARPVLYDAVLKGGNFHGDFHGVFRQTLGFSMGLSGITYSNNWKFGRSNCGGQWHLKVSYNLAISGFGTILKRIESMNYQPPVPFDGFWQRSKKDNDW